ncbi:MAG TPA: hypothetical protein VEI80_01795, partial [Candidatus Acidoferrales bacterium]|nr:hypothetical protein [Candidatus Acidoferrales bacterium]
MNRSLRSVGVYLLLLPLFVATFEGVGPVQGASGPIFTVSMSPSTQNAYQGQTITYTVTVTQTYSCVVTLQAQSSGTIPTPSMTPSSAEGNFTSIFTLQIPQTTSPGTYGLGVVATIASSPSGSNCPSGDVGEVAGGSATVVVQAAAFTITPTPSTLTASQGGTASISISVNP